MNIVWRLATTALLLSSSSWINVVDAKKAVSNEAVDLTSDHSTKEAEPMAIQLVKWLDSLPKGMFNAKQEVRQANESSEKDAFYGIFAKEFISKGEVLAEIPWDVIITDEESDPSLSEGDLDGVLKCGTVRNLAKEMKQVETLGKYVEDAATASKYGPYIQYLMDQDHTILPSAWTDSGKLMLNDVLGGQHQSLPPAYMSTWLTEDFYEDCNGDPEDEIAAKAAMLVVMRADDDLLVPVYDMYNHRNGKYYNTNMIINRGKGYKIVAKQDIHPGDQIYNSYNMCAQCGGRRDGYGTPEIFRDYGFIENFPQRWNFEEQEFLVDLFKNDKTGEISVRWGKKPTEPEDIEETMGEIKQELRSLVKTRKFVWKHNYNDGKPTIKESEWNAVWEYQDAMTTALTLAYNDLADDDKKIPIGDETCTSEGVCGMNYFDELDWAKDSLKYNIQTCNNEGIMMFPEYWMMEGLKTHYQVLNFAFRPGNENREPDICMDLEDTVQICSSYRPHYHEFSSHFAARFVDNVKKVVFVGGGDSMMLHEVLKYPSLEKVVGLELDQTVVRKSFKYFNTQAHFDNDKVEWWFGDATKSLLLLPEDYWSSFDLVIIDLSETVMALTVNEKLDVFDALALLLNEDGVMVKNEHYMDTMSKSFDYTMQLYLDENPKICSQCMIFGSNRADFFHKPVVEHGVETLLLEPVAELKDGYDYFHDFRKNNATKSGKCNLDTEKTVEDEQTKSAGLLHILDAEEVGVNLDDKTVEKVILAAAKAEGYTKVKASKDGKLSTIHQTVESRDQESTMVNVVFEEGYVSARIWPKENYVAVDVGVWGSFVEGDKLRKRIGKDLKAGTTSFFRIVVGGMYGSSTWDKDKYILGPQMVQHRNCEIPDVTAAVEIEKKVQNVIYDEVVNFVGSEEATVAVLCGIEGVDECSSIETLQPAVGKVIPVWMCPDTEFSNFAKMAECEDNVLAYLMEALNNDDNGIELFVLDESATLELGSIIHSILDTEFQRDLLLSEGGDYMVSLSKKLESEQWRTNLLERYRQEERFDPVKLTKFELTVDGAVMELDILSTDAEKGFRQYKTLEETLNAKLATVDSKASAEVISVTGGLFNFQENFDPHYYAQKDYPEQPGLDQYAAQKPLGRKTVVQFDKPEKGDAIDEQGFVRLIDSSLAAQTLYKFDVYTNVGDGIVVVSDFGAGSVVAQWDGRSHADLSIFLHDDSEAQIKKFIDNFTKLAKGKFDMGLRDDFPRGTGRVMNFKADLSYAGLASLKMEKPYVDA